MNIAFGTIVLFLIFVPGIIFRQTYYSGEFSKKYLKTQVFDELIWAIIPGAIIQVLGILLIIPVSNYQIDFAALSYLLIGTSKDINSVYTFKVLNENLIQILYYNSLLWIISASLGVTFRISVRKFKLDRKIRWLRFNNEWHYLLSGELLDFPHAKGQHGNIDFTNVDVLVKSANENIIYSGQLGHYILGADGGLDRIYLRNVQRRTMEKENKQKSQYYKMPGEFLSYHTLIYLTCILNI